jgi:ATP-dependent Clp protease adaptor protein ClpS
MPQTDQPAFPDTGKPGTTVLPRPADPITKKAPLYHVILHDDDQHTYEYVIAMLMRLFGKSQGQAFRHACEVDSAGVTIVETTTLERAELKRDQIRAFGRDPLLLNSRGSMCATIEPAE